MKLDHGSGFIRGPMKKVRTVRIIMIKKKKADWLRWTSRRLIGRLEILSYTAINFHKLPSRCDALSLNLFTQPKL